MTTQHKEIPMLITIIVVLSAFAFLGYYVQKDLRDGTATNPFKK
jgi:hypothetical protein